MSKRQAIGGRILAARETSGLSLWRAARRLVGSSARQPVSRLRPVNRPLAQSFTPAMLLPPRSRISDTRASCERAKAAR